MQPKHKYIMAKPFKFDMSKHGNINDNGVKDLPLGKHNYVITKIGCD